jgi:plastocyanin
MEPNTSTSAPQSEKNNSMMFVIGIVVLLLIGVGIVFAMNRSTMQPPETMTTTQPTTVQEQPTVAAETTIEPSEAMAKDGEVKEFTVTGRNFSFSPSTMRVKQGDRVKITFENTGGFHDFVIDEFDVKTAQIQDGESEVVEFVADKKGTFDYYCSVGQHRQNGMEGKLIVE